MLRHVFVALMFMLILVPLPAKADMVLDWNEYALQTIRDTSTAPPVASRALAITHAAIYDSVNSIYKTNQKYYTQPSGFTKYNTSAEAAVAAAGYTSLKKLFGDSLYLQDKYAKSLAAITAGGTPAANINKGELLGQQVADLLLTFRSTDGWNSSSTYTPTNPPLPGHWQPTPPGFLPPSLPQWGNLKPQFTMTSNTQFRQVAPPLLDSQRYTDEFNEVKLLGKDNSVTRTPDQTEIAYFWVDGPGSQTPPGHWNSIAQEVATSENTTLAENARLFALLNLAEADAAISAWQMKYEYDFWRPITGIRAGDDDTNGFTEGDPTWTPLLITPPFPAYVSGHSIFSAAGAAILADLFGNNTSFTSDSDKLEINGNPVVLTRTFNSFSQAALEAGRSRIYGGIHWECDNEFGWEAGDALGKYVSANYLTAPLPGTLTMTLTGFGAMLLTAWRRRR